MQPSAKVILDSISPTGDRLTTLEVKFHRFVLAEFNTHRMFSRSSASSRAIPIQKQIEKMLADPAFPLEYRYNQAGMQPAELMTQDDKDICEHIIHQIMDYAAEKVDLLSRVGPTNPKTGKPLGLAKQWANRYLEPWMAHTVIVSSTEWNNFFRQRVSELAQKEIQVPAELMLRAIDTSIPQELGYGEYHTPYIQSDELEPGTDLWLPLGERKKVSAARCARVSYLTQDGIRDHAADLKLWERLITADPEHAAPLEMVARPQEPRDEGLGNFVGWTQLRHEVLNV
jgi:hypothetical protein